MRKVLSLVILAVLMLTRMCSAQGFGAKSEFDCGTIAPNGSGAMVYQDFGHGFRFEFPGDWMGNWLFLRGPLEAMQVSVDPRFASSDPKFYVEHAKPRRTETINGLTWVVLNWEQGGRGYYTYSHGVAVELFALAFGKGKAADPATLAALRQILSTFTFFDDPYRVDRQLAALKVGQKLGDLTVTRIVPGAGGLEHPFATVEFAGQLTLTGNMVLPSPTMGGGWGPYQLFLDDQNRRSIPHLNCPVESLMSVSRNFAVGFTNQEFTNQQFAQVPSISGNHAWYEAETTVVVDKIAQDFSSLGDTSPAILANLVKVISKREKQ